MSWSPRAFLLKGFLSDKETEHLINKVCLLSIFPCTDLSHLGGWPSVLSQTPMKAVHELG